MLPLTEKQCPFCYEFIYHEADICKHCGSEQRDRKMLINYSITHLLIIFVFILIAIDVASFLESAITGVQVSFWKKAGKGILVGIPMALLVVSIITSKEESAFSIVKTYKILKRLSVTAIAIFTISLIFMVCIGGSFFLIPPPPMDHFKTYIQEEEKFTPSQIIKEEDNDFVTFHSVHNENELRVYIGAWNGYHCFYRKTIKSIKAGIAKGAGNELFEEVHRKSFQELKE